MNNPTLEKVTEEISRLLTGKRFGRVFVLGKARLVVDFRLQDGDYLFISAEPQSPRMHLVKRKVRELERSSLAETSFSASLRKHLGGAETVTIEKTKDERIVAIDLRSDSDLEGPASRTLVIQLTGRSSNVFLLDGGGVIIDSLKKGKGAGQEPGEPFRAPERPFKARSDEKVFEQGEHPTLSEALDQYYSEAEQRQILESVFRNAESGLKKQLKRQVRLRKALARDLEEHGDEQEWKRFGDLLLANASNAIRKGGKFAVTDYFSDEAPEIEIEADPRHTPSEAAEEYFRRYTKARNAKVAIAERIEIAEAEAERIGSKLKDLRKVFEEGDLERIQSEFGARPGRKSGKTAKQKKNEDPSGTRKFISRDGFEILVGKKSKDNDYLTFRIARSLDTWMHAADYPGSHVVIRNPGRKEIPPSTLADAAKLAAFYSKARGEAKAAVHYTLKKFVHKPKGAKPGLVSLADFKTLMVEPGIPETGEE